MRDKIIKLLQESLDSLFTIDKRNIDMDVSEMNLCSRLAHYMENMMKEDTATFNGYYADTEYNRNYGGTIKKVEYSNDGPKSVRCDLLIHSRGLRNPDNLLALEMKKEGNERKVIEDYDRLENITKPRTDSTPKDCVCGTVVGVFLEISSKGYRINMTWYENNEVCHDSKSKPF